jgi:hypothetical protein
VRILFWIGLVVLVLGIVSLFVPLPHHQREGIKAGNVDFGVDVSHDEKISPWASAALIIGGAGMMIAGRPRH